MTTTYALYLLANGDIEWAAVPMEECLTTDVWVARVDHVPAHVVEDLSSGSYVADVWADLVADCPHQVLDHEGFRRYAPAPDVEDVEELLPRWSPELDPTLSRHLCRWYGSFDTEVDGRPTTLEYLEVQVGLTGELLEDTWRGWLRNPRFDLIPVSEPPSAGVLEHWRQWISASWLAERRRLLAAALEREREGERTGGISKYDTRAESREAMRRMRILLHAYSRPAAAMPAAARLAMEWRGTPKDFIATVDDITA